VNIDNSGIMTTGGGTTNIGQATVGSGARITNTYPAPQPAQSSQSRHSPALSRGIGVVVIKDNEARAVIDGFGLARERDARSGRFFYTGTVESADGPVDLVATRTLEQGNRSIMSTLDSLRFRIDPALVVLVGIGGGINEQVALGDVVVADRVVYYDRRRETPDGVFRRGEERHSPASVTHAVNSFFTDHHERLSSAAGPFRVLSGPIGSGDAVIMDAESELRSFLLTYNENVLAVDMEAGGLTQFCHETYAPKPAWLVVRGISDLADRKKTADHQAAAAHNAAVVLENLIPYLPAKT
jgi:adenosylhomocysteine nucleosidase